MFRTSATTLGPKVVIDSTTSGLDAESKRDARAQVLGKRRTPSESDKSEFGLKSAKSGVGVSKNHDTSARSGEANETTEEVAPDCYNYISCRQTAEPGNTYCNKCENERRCLDYPTCDGKPGVGELFCESCLEVNKEKEVCQNCDNYVGLNETLCEPCMEEAALRSNGLLWWEEGTRGAQ